MVESIRQVCYGGYYSTGGSVVRDILKECEPNINFPNEFRVIRERHGLIDLHHNLFRVTAPENIDEALTDFLWLAKNLDRNEHYASNSGFSYSKYTDDRFLDLSSSFVSDLTTYHYPMWWHFRNFRQPTWKTVLIRFQEKLRQDNRRQRAPRSTARMALVSEQEFRIASRKYLQDFCKAFSRWSRSTLGVVGLHNAIPPFYLNDVELSLDLLGDARLIVTDRDPRDVFMNYPKDSYGRYLPASDSLITKADGFIRFFKKVRADREKISRLESVTLMNFEDFVVDYEESVQKVFDFFELPRSAHARPMTIFSPKASAANVGMWRKARGEMGDAIALIEQELVDYIRA